MLSDCVKKREPRWRNDSQQVLLLPPPKFGIQADATKSRLMFSYSVSSDGPYAIPLGEEKHAFPLPSFLTSCWTPHREALWAWMPEAWLQLQSLFQGCLAQKGAHLPPSACSPFPSLSFLLSTPGLWWLSFCWAKRAQVSKHSQDDTSL